MVENPFALTSERNLFDEYERRRRSRLVQIAAPLLSTMGGTFFLIFALTLFWPGNPPPQGALYVIWGIVGLAAALLGVCGWLAFHEREELAGNAVSLVISGSIIAAALIWNIGQGIDPFGLALIAIFGLPIVFAGLLHGPAMITGTTLVTGTLTLGLIFFAPKTGSAASEVVLWGAVIFIAQIGFAGVVLAVWNNYQQTFHELSRLYLQVKQVDEIKDQFITSVNHELRNPVMAMHGYIDVLRIKHRTMDADRREQILHQASQVGDRVINLLASILDARRLDYGADDFLPQPVGVLETITIAEQLINPLEGNLADRDIRRTAPDDLRVWGDPVRLQQVLTNLISNALKYSPPDTPIEIAAYVVTEALSVQGPWLRNIHQEHALVEITVRDHGLGIPPEQIPLLFRRFVRLPRDLASTTIGNGLGLYLCKVFIEAMRGRIWVESSGEPGDGATFHIRLPLPPADFAPALSGDEAQKLRDVGEMLIGKD